MAHSWTRAALRQTCVAITAIAAAALSCCSQANWQAEQRERVQEAVLADLIEEVRAGRAGTELADRAVCVELWNTNDPSTSDVQSDPSEALLSHLRAADERVLPASSCSNTDRGPVDRTTGQAAVIVAVGTPEWESRQFVRMRGYWLVGPLAAAGFRYTVSFSGGKWSVDTAKAEWIASAARRRHVRASAAGCASHGKFATVAS